MHTGRHNNSEEKPQFTPTEFMIFHTGVAVLFSSEEEAQTFWNFYSAHSRSCPESRLFKGFEANGLHTDTPAAGFPDSLEFPNSVLISPLGPYTTHEHQTNIVLDLFRKLQEANVFAANIPVNKSKTTPSWVVYGHELGDEEKKQEEVKSSPSPAEAKTEVASTGDKDILSLSSSAFADLQKSGMPKCYCRRSENNLIQVHFKDKQEALEVSLALVGFSITSFAKPKDVVESTVHTWYFRLMEDEYNYVRSIFQLPDIQNDPDIMLRRAIQGIISSSPGDKKVEERREAIRAAYHEINIESTVGTPTARYLCLKKLIDDPASALHKALAKTTVRFSMFEDTPLKQIQRIMSQKIDPLALAFSKMPSCR